TAESFAGAGASVAHFSQAHFSQAHLSQAHFSQAHARPGPVGDDGDVGAVFAGPGAGREARVDHGLPQARSLLAQGGYAVDDIHDQVIAVEVVEHDHVEGRGGGALLLVAAHVQIVVIGAPVG